MARRGATRWQRIQQLFDDALALPQAERDAFLARACAGDASLRRELDALLAGHEGAAELDEAMAAARASVFAAGAGGESPEGEAGGGVGRGRRIGAYRVIRELGRGGMGRVYLAERADDTYRGRVAIKLVRADESAGLSDRFRTERQLLADLAHPNIARLLDGGTTEDGEPYLVMEHVEGAPIDAWCDERRLPTEARVRLALQVCAAVQHAHAALIVHRDLKPSNILVTGEGVPKLLDFGIAKLLDPARSTELALHRTGDATRVFTPSAASPEQLRGEPITTATDVYALGVLLYQLFTGTSPYAVDPGDPLGLQRAILEQEPVRPSVAVRRGSAPGASGRRASNAMDDAGARAAARGASPDRLSRRLAGDLDTIVLMALRKDPSRRYASVAQLAEDLDRHLRGLPVLARGDSFGYLTRRFMRRHRPVFAAAGVVVLAVTGVVGFYTARLATERDRARVEARRAEEVSRFLVGLFEVSDPERARGEAITARELLDRGAVRVDRELSGEPEVRATMMGVMGSVYAALGLYDPAEGLLRRVVDERRSAVAGRPDAALAAGLHALGDIAFKRGEYARADSLFTESLAMRREVLGPDHAEVGQSLLQLGSLADLRGDYETAAAHLAGAERIARSLSPPDSLRLAQILVAAAGLRQSLGQYDSASARLERAVAIRAAVSGAEHPATLAATRLLVDALVRAGRIEEARALQARSVEVLERILPPEHPQLAQALQSLATTLKTQGRYADALPLQARALEIFRAALPGDHQSTATALNNLANIRHDLRDLDGALELHHASLAMKRRLFGDDYPGLADSYNNIASVLFDRQDLEGAAEMFRRTLEHDRRTLGEDHPWVGPDLVAVGSVMSRMGRHDEAEALMRQAVEHTRRVSGQEHPLTGNALRELGIVLVRQHRCPEAGPLLEEARRILDEAYPGDPWETAVIRSYLGACYADAGRLADAEPLLRSGYERLLDLRGPEDWMVGDARDLLARSTAPAGSRPLESHPGGGR